MITQKTMRSVPRNRGSVLVVVLAVCAILALLGMTLVTISSIDRQAAENYHEEAQMRALAKGAVHYVCGKLVEDIWEGDVLLTEHYDVALSADAWLTESNRYLYPASGARFSFSTAAGQTRFGVSCGGTTALVDNPGAGYNWGIWAPDLVVPFENGRVGMVSLNVFDHSGMVNMNVHGDDLSSIYGSQIGDAEALVGPTTTISAAKRTDLLTGTYGRAARPFSMADETELRRLNGSAATSQLELAWPDSFSASGSASDAIKLNRLMRATTYSRTSTARNFAGTIYGRPDINTADASVIRTALEAAGVTGDLNQIAANIADFSDADNTPTVVGEGVDARYGIERQCFISDAQCTREEATPPPNPTYNYDLTIRLYSPYGSDGIGDATPGLDVTNWLVHFGTASQVISATELSAGDVLSFTLEQDGVPDGETREIRITRLAADGTTRITIDRIGGTHLAPLLADGKVARKIRQTADSRGQTVVYIGEFEDGVDAPAQEEIGGPTQTPTRLWPVVIPNSVAAGARNRTAALQPLPPFDNTGSSYRAFARLGDLNQVLTVGNPFPSGMDAATDEFEVKFNWVTWHNASNYLSAYDPANDGIDNDGDGTADDGKGDFYSGAAIAAAGEPEWVVDGRVNLNTANTLTTGAALFFGNRLTGWGTSTDAWYQSFAVANAIRDRWKGGSPLTSAAEVLNVQDTGGGYIVRGEGTTYPFTIDENGDGYATDVEKRDAVWTRISNIADVRSDTFGVYGTVRVVRDSNGDGTITNDEIMTRRRFWALIDRSPCLVYSPTDPVNSFMSPRIVVFTWLD